MFCRKCGTEIKDGTIFCSNCGENINRINEPSEAFTQTNNSSNNDKAVSFINSIISTKFLLSPQNQRLPHQRRCRSEMRQS